MTYIILLHKNGFGGIESYMAALIQSIQNKGFSVKLFCHKSPNRNNFIFKNISGGYIRFFLEILTTNNYKIIFNNSLPLFLSIFLPFEKISLIHGYPVRHKWFYSFLFKFGNQFFYSNSKYLKSIILNEFKSDLDFIYPLVRNQIIQDSFIISNNFLNITSKNTKNYNIGFLGRIAEIKNIDKIIKFHNNINKVYNNVKFYLMGNGQYDYKIKLINLSSNPENIIFLDYSINLNDYFEKVDINFLVTTKIESYGISIAESLLYNKQCIIPEYLMKDFEEVGNVFPWNDSYLESIEKSIEFYNQITKTKILNSRNIIIERNKNNLNKIL